MKTKKWMTLCLTGMLAFSAAACGMTGTEVKAAEEAEDTKGAEDTDSEKVSEDTEGAKVSEALEKIDMSKWLYNEDDDVYYQTGISYCADPADASYETLAVFVPGAYMYAMDNGDGTFSCELNDSGKINGYTAFTAPIVMPINTPGYSAQSALTEYTDVTEYTDAGFVYVHAGCRGRDAGAPAGVTDLKAAIRYIRYCDDFLAGDAESIFTFGMSGGGAQSAVVGSTGDSELYDAYLEEIGAVEGYSDAVLGSMCWCPITNLDSADEAYEWMMGTTRTDLSEEEQAVSDALAEAFADYINGAGLQDEDGNVLTLEESEDGIYQAGSYYEYLKEVIEQSLNNFLSDTEFPYEASASGNGQGGPGGDFGGRGDGFSGRDGDFGGNGGRGGEFNGDGVPGSKAGFGKEFDGQGGPGGDGDFGGRGEDFNGQGDHDRDYDGTGGPDGEFKDRGEDFNGEGGSGRGSNFDSSGDPDVLSSDVSFEEMDDITRNDTHSGLSLTGTYESAEEYIDALNENGVWVTYDAETNTVSITSIEDFVKAFKSASKNLGAFDQLDGGQGENQLFGYGDGSGAHFDETLAGILEALGLEEAADYAADLEKTDAAGNTAETRLNMYTPLYYLLESSEGYETSEVAEYWRIRTGITQSDTALSTEVNLALALENYEGVEDVDFETVWGAGHTMAERTGDSTSNFIDWVDACME